MITPQEVLTWTGAVCGLPLPQQATCILIAAEKSLFVWQQWAQRRNILDLSGPLITCFKHWLNMQVSSNELNTIASRFGKSLPVDLREEDDPSGGYAGYALHDVALVALDQWADVHSDIVYTSILYAAAAFCGIGHEAIWVSPKRLSRAELDFIADWWTQCCEQFPGLLEIADAGKRE